MAAGWQVAFPSTFPQWLTMGLTETSETMNQKQTSKQAAMKIQHQQLSSFQVFLLVIYHSDLKKIQPRSLSTSAVSMFLLKDISWVFVLFILRSWLWEIIGKAKAVQSPVGFFHLMMNMQNLNVLLKDPYTLSTLVPLLSALSKQALATILSIYLSRHNWGGDLFPAPSILLWVYGQLS